MDPVTASSASIQAVNQVMKNANAATIEVAEKLMKFTVESAVSGGKVAGKGDAVDMVA